MKELSAAASFLLHVFADGHGLPGPGLNTKHHFGWSRNSCWGGLGRLIGLGERIPMTKPARLGISE